MWLRNASEIRDGEGRYTIRTNPIIGRLDEFKSVLEISESSASDHGPYLCRVTNPSGQKAEVIIKLQPKGSLFRFRDVTTVRRLISNKQYQY